MVARDIKNFRIDEYGAVNALTVNLSHFEFDAEVEGNIILVYTFH